MDFSKGWAARAADLTAYIKQAAPATTGANMCGLKATPHFELKTAATAPHMRRFDHVGHCNIVLGVY